MNMTAVISIIAALPAIAALGLLFCRQTIAVWLAAASLLLIVIFKEVPQTDTQLITWFIASLIASGVCYAAPRVNFIARAYLCAGAIAGTIVGFVASPSTAGIIIGSSAGAFLGALAFVRTPASGKPAIISQTMANYLGACGLPAIVTCSIAAIVISSLF